MGKDDIDLFDKDNKYMGFARYDPIRDAYFKYDKNGNYLGQVNKNVWGDAVETDSNGNYVGVARTEFGRSVSRTPHGEYMGESRGTYRFKSDREQDTGSSYGSTSACYVATCVYGSYDCPQVRTLRRFRDCSLAKTWYGRAFIKVYYKVSPVIVRLFGKSELFRSLFCGPLDRMVKHLQARGFESTPYTDGDGKS